MKRAISICKKLGALNQRRAAVSRRAEIETEAPNSARNVSLISLSMRETILSSAIAYNRGITLKSNMWQIGKLVYL